MNTFALRLMGPVTLCRMSQAGDEQEIRLPRAGQALLALLATAPDGAPLSRERIAETLWPDAAPESSRGCLNTAIWRLRSAMGTEGPIRTQGRWLALAGPEELRVDLRELAACLKALPAERVSDWPIEAVADLEAAVSARRGVFLDGVDGDWTQAARQSCADTYESGLEALIHFHRHRGRVDRSIDAARRLVRQDPYREDIHALLVELHADSGRPAKASAQYEECRTRLARDLGVEPGPALRAALDRARGPAPPSGDQMLEMVRAMDRTLGRIARQIDDIRVMLERAGR